MIASTTYEEAPARLVPWLRQRTRWFKGWMQTWLVHMREPRRLARELGFAGFLAFQLLVGGTVLSALVHPLFAVLLAVGWLDGRLSMSDPIAAIPGVLYATTLVAGYLASGLLGAVGLARRGLAATSLVAGADTAALGAALARGLARARPARARSLSLGEDRARAGAHLAACAGGFRPHRVAPPAQPARWQVLARGPAPDQGEPDEDRRFRFGGGDRQPRPLASVSG